MQPLKDIRVLSVTVFLAGPFLGMTLARFGAEVIKVEPPGTGDPIRNAGPYATRDGVSLNRQSPDDLSIRFLKRSEGVKCVSLNLKSERGREMFLQMAAQSDVLIENLSPGSMQRMGLDYEAVRAANPKIIYCSIAGYGQTGPYRDMPAHDHQIQAMSGIMDMNGDPDGPPTRVGVFVGDLVTPLYAAYSIMGALRHREQTGEGQYLDASMIDTLATLMFMEPMEQVLHDGGPVRAGNGSRNGITGLYRVADGDVIITIGNPLRWQRLCIALGLQHLLEDSRYATEADQEMHAAELRKTVQAAMSGMTCEEAISQLGQGGIPIAKVRTLPEVVADPHFRDRGTLKPMYRADTEQPVERGIVPGFPVTFSSGPLPRLPGGAGLGHHNAEVYASLLGLSEEDLKALAAEEIL